MQRAELAKYIDHTILGPTATKEGVKKLCAEAVQAEVAAVCVNPCHAELARECLGGFRGQTLRRHRIPAWHGDG